MTGVTVRVKLLASAIVVGTVVFLAGCSSNPIQAGAAAVVGTEQIKESTVADQVAEVQRARGLAPEAPDETLVRQTLERLVTETVIMQLAEQNDVSVTQGEVDRLFFGFEEQAGGRAELEKLLLEQGVPASQVESVARLNVYIEALGRKLAPNADVGEQGQIVFTAAVEYADEVGVQVSPRFGTWDAQQFIMGPVPTDLATPPAS